MHVARGDNSDEMSYWRGASELVCAENLARDTQRSWVPARAKIPVDRLDSITS